jgi:Glu-tRNA(Gln) amidotransferase subunit E-like FAD-binding protein
MKKTTWQYKLQWEVPLQMPTKMCCACAVQHSTPNLTKQKRKTHSFQVSSFASRVTPHSTNQMWQSWDHGVRGRDLLIHLHYLPARVCGVELGTQAPHPPNLQLLSTCEQIAEAFYFQIPHCYYVIRHPSPKYSHILGYQRKILLGLNGSIQYKDLKIKLNEFILKESGCHAVSLNKNTPHIHHAHLGTQGNPLLSWTTSWLQLPPQVLVSIAQHLKDATGTLGLLSLKEGLFSLECKKNQRNFKVQNIANCRELLSSIQQLEAEKSKENIHVEIEDQTYQTIKTLNKSSRTLGEKL